MKKLAFVLGMMVLVAVSMFSPAMAADAAPTFGDTFSAFLTNSVFPFLGALITGFVAWAARKIGTKYKIESLIADNNFLVQLATQGVAFAEERAANFAKNAAPLTASDKLNSAIAYIMQHAPKITPEQAQSLVTAVLAMLPNVGATGPSFVTPAVSAGSVTAPPATAAPDPLAVAP